VANKALTYGLYLNAAALGLIALALFARSDSPSMLPAAFGQQAPQPIAGGAGLFLMPAQLSSSTWGCYVMDVDAQTLMAYQYYAGDRRMRLMAARDISSDRKLGEFNTDGPTPTEVRAWVAKQQDNTRQNVPAGNAAPGNPTP
jgi:hypothetical protein